MSPGTALTRNDVTGSHLSGTGSHVTGTDHVCMRNRFPRFFHTLEVPLRMTGSSMATGCDVIKRHVTPKGFSGKGGCAHAQPEIVQYSP